MLPFSFHWNTGAVPPLTGVAVNVTIVDEQTEPEGLAEILTDAGPAEETFMTMTLEVAVLDTAQVALTVTTQEIWSPLSSVLLV